METPSEGMGCIQDVWGPVGVMGLYGGDVGLLGEIWGFQGRAKEATGPCRGVYGVHKGCMGPIESVWSHVGGVETL